ncbi:ODFP1 protein, partial [Erpornis zantholeuca]|nr:ODFP1 protein [Erpornis zantholeuca]
SRLRRLGMMLSSCRSHSHLALCDAKCCDPCDPCVTVKDGKVTVSSEHKEEHDCLLGQSCHHTRCLKEFSLPPCDDEVTVVES